MQIDKGAEYGCYNLGNYLRSCFYINKKSKSAGSKKHAAKQTETAAEADTADMEQHAEYSSVGYECIEPDISRRKQQPQMQQRAHQPQRPQMQQRVQPQQRPQQSNPDIVQRAVKNNARFADDTTQKRA